MPPPSANGGAAHNGAAEVPGLLRNLKFGELSTNMAMPITFMYPSSALAMYTCMLGACFHV